MTAWFDPSSDPKATVDALADLLSDGPALLLTGAGISTDSGIPDYRSPDAPPRNPMRIDQYLHDDAYRRRFWAGARLGFETMRVEPNAGHRAAAALETAGRLTGIATQNVDGLHQRAGAHRVVELHGSGATIRCVEHGHRWSRAEVLGWFDTANPGFAEAHAGARIAPDGDAEVDDVAGVAVPVCPACGGMLRPDVVYFGEHVPVEVFARAETLLAEASALLIAGSSLAVNTGVRLVHRAARRGIPIGVINRGPTTADPRATVRVEGGVSETLAGLAARLGA